MTPLDFFYAWIAAAISKPFNDTRKYYYDRNEDTLFGFYQKGAERVPRLRNESLPPNELIIKSIVAKIQSIGKDGILEIPGIPLHEREDFIVKYKQKHPELPQNIFDNIIDGGYFRNDDLYKKMKKISHNVDWFFAEGEFLVHWQKKLVYPMGISENSKILA